jgi:quinone-modifying oxidoreductase subunit QmoA
LEINYQRLRRDRRIEVFTSSELVSISGSSGSFRVTIRQSGQYVSNLCTTCGECVPVCPVERQDEPWSLLKASKAIHLPEGITYPYRYAIDEASCLKGNCRKCETACTYGAINLDAQPKEVSLEVCSIILATGWKPYDATKLAALGYGLSDKIITSLGMETLVGSNDPTRVSPSPAPVIAFAQCAGSRDINHLPYCSAICCGTTLKQALWIRELLPDSRVLIFYIDLRVQGRNEDMLARAQSDPGIRFIKGKLTSSSLQEHQDKVLVEAEDTLAGKKIKMPVDLLVLATGMTAEKCREGLFTYLPNGFIDRNKLPDGIFAVGNAVHPSDVQTSVKEATAAVLRGLQTCWTAGRRSGIPEDQ